LHLTKGGAQDWLRHLFGMETQASGAADNGSHGKNDPVVSSAATPPAQADKEQTRANDLLYRCAVWAQQVSEQQDVRRGIRDAAFNLARELHSAIATTQAPAPAAPVLSDEMREKLARLIYEQWADRPGYVPWVEGGNSFKQDDARAILAAGAMGEKTNAQS
jgi:hypothetical protein